MDEQIKGQVDIHEAIEAAAAEAEIDTEALAERLAAAGGELSDEEAAALSAPQPVQLPMMQVPLTNCRLQIVPNDEGGKNILVGPIAITFLLPLAAAGVQNVVRDLSGSSLVVASALPPKLEVVR
jgi:hypothetical protein